jgi:hypothetical protein
MMRIPSLSRSFLAICLTLCASGGAKASEYAFSSYGLGGAAFGAGVTPPPGTYVTAVTGFYSGEIGGAVNFGNVTLNAGAKVEGFTSAANILYVPQRKVFGGNLGLSVTVPVGHVDLDATVGITPGPVVSRSVDGWGLGDVVSKAQLGWTSGEFSHTVYLQAVAPTGRWDPGFSPIVGLHRPGIDTGWAFTWADKRSKLQVNGAAGVTFNFENTETDYRSGNEFHFEWAVGLECTKGLVIGIVGYDYRQLTGDSGAAATLGSFKGSVDAIGAGLSYTTLIGKTPLVLNLRHYHEFNADNRFEGNSTLASGTIRF